MNSKEILQLISRISGVPDISKIIKDDMPAIIEHIKTSFGVRDLSKELNDLANEKIDEIERRINPGSLIKLKPEEIKKITQRFSENFVNIKPDELPNEDLYAQFQRIISDLLKDFSDDEGDES